MKRIIYILCLLILVACQQKETPSQPVEQEDTNVKKTQEVENQEKENIIVEEEQDYKPKNHFTYEVYFSNSDGTELIKEELETILPFIPYPTDEQTLEETISFLIEELKRADIFGAYPTVPKEVELLNITYEDNVLTLNFNHQLHEELSHLVDDPRELIDYSKRTNLEEMDKEEIKLLDYFINEYTFIDSVITTMMSNFKEVEHIYIATDGEKVQRLVHFNISNGFSIN